MKNKNAQPTSLKKLILNYLIALVPLFIYGYYKNYLLVYNRKLISFNNLFRPLLILIGSILIFALVEIIFTLIKKEKVTLEKFLSFSLIYTLIIILLLPYNFNTFIYFIVLTMMLIIQKLISLKKIPLNLVAVTTLLLLFSFKYIGNYSYANIYETTKNISYNLFNSFFGRTIGSYGTTNIFLILIGYLFLLTNPLFKKEIPITTIISFIIIGLIFSLTKIFPFMNLVSYLVESNFIFGTIYILPLSFYSPYTMEGNIIFAIIAGILSFIFMYFISSVIGSIIAIICTSSLVGVIDFIVLKIKRKGCKNEDRRL